MMNSQQSSCFSFGDLHRNGVPSNEPSEAMDYASKLLAAGVKITRINKAFQKGSTRRIAEDVPSNVIYEACRTIQGRKWLLSHTPAQESVVPGQAETPSNEDFMKPVQIDSLRGNCSLADLKQQLADISNPEQRVHLADKYHKQDLTSTGTTDVFQMDSNIDWKVIREVHEEDQLISLAPHSLRTTNYAQETHQNSTILQKGLSQRQTKKDPTNQWAYELRGMKRSMHEIGENNLKEICLTNSHHGEDHGQKSPYFEVYNDNIHRVRVSPAKEQNSLFNLQFRGEGRSEHNPRKPLMLMLESLNNSSCSKRELRDESQQEQIEELKAQNKSLSQQQKLFERELAEFEQRIFVELQSMQSKMDCLEKGVSDCNRELLAQQSLAEMREKDRNLSILKIQNDNLKAIVSLQKDPIPFIHLLGIFAVVAVLLILALGRRAFCQ